MAEIRDGTELLKRLEKALPAEALTALTTCINLANARQLSLFLVGGAVRDLILGRSHIDLDIAVEGHPATLANEVAQTLGCKAVLHPRFGTATVSSPGFQLDLAQTRRETYVRPGALPQVEPAPIKEDLRRRDFSINAVALRLTQPVGEIIDPYSGEKDLADGILRVLHEDSFKDDATRALRGVRYGSRLEFRFASDTANWLRRDSSYVESISGPRLRRELAFLFLEPNAPTAALMAEDYGILHAIRRELSIDTGLASRWQAALAGPSFAPVDELGFCLLAAPRTTAEAEDVSRRLHLAGRVEQVLTGFVQLRGLSAKLATVCADPVAAVDLLDGFPAAAVWALGIITDGATGEACVSYLSTWRKVKTRLNGRDLLDLGVAPGKAVGEALSLVRHARLEGRVETREDEIELITTGEVATKGA